MESDRSAPPALRLAAASRARQPQRPSRDQRRISRIVAHRS